MENGYPPGLLLLGLRCYLGPRLLIWNGTAGMWLSPNTSICAGCVRANDMARVVMYDVLDAFHAQNPNSQLCQFVDDVQAAQDAKLRDAVVAATRAASNEFSKLCEERGLVLSAKKTCIISNCAKAGREAQACIAKDTGVRYPVLRCVKNLGVDMGGGRRRLRATAKKGMSAAEKRIKRVAKLARAKKIAGKIFRTAAWQQASFTAAADGMAPSELARVRRLARSSCQVGNSGSCATTLIAMCHGSDYDPAVRVLTGQVKEWRLVWTALQNQRLRITQAWVEQLKFLGTKREKVKWLWARGQQLA